MTSRSSAIERYVLKKTGPQEDVSTNDRGLQEPERVSNQESERFFEKQTPCALESPMDADLPEVFAPLPVREDRNRIGDVPDTAGERLHLPHLRGEVVPAPHIVGIEEGDPLTPGRADPGVSRSAHSLVIPVNHSDPVPVGFQGLAGAIGGAIVHDDDLAVPELLAENAFDGQGDKGRPVVRGDDHTELRHKSPISRKTKSEGYLTPG